MNPTKKMILGVVLLASAVASAQDPSQQSKLTTYKQRLATCQCGV